MGAFGFGPELAPGRARRRVAAFDFAGSLPPGATLTRSSTATRWTASGVLATEPVDGARFDHDPVTLAYRGLLLEPAATNLLARSAAFEAAAWNAVNVTVAADQANAPDGIGAADQLSATTASGYIYQPLTLTAATDHVLSVFVRSAGPAATLNLEVFAGGGDGYALGPLAVTTGAGWQRVMVTGNTAALAAPFWAALGGAGSFSTGETLLAWGIQLETGMVASSYIPTGATSAARGADQLVLDWGGQGLPDGAISVRYTFDDGSSQDVATTVAGGTAAVPTGLNRRWLRRAEKL